MLDKAPLLPRSKLSFIHWEKKKKKNLGRSLPTNQMSPSVDNYVSQFGTWGPQSSSKEEEK